MQKTAPAKPNPLSNLMRKPKLKISLPSRGNYWKRSSINLSDDNTYDVYSLTARDGLLLKNPALISSGQAFVDIVKSCVPDIIDVWDTPSIDVDALMLAIKVASHGPITKEKVTVEDQEFTVDVDLTVALQSLENIPEWEPEFDIGDGIKVYLKPISYKTLSLVGKESAETQKIFNIVNDDTIDESKKIETFQKSFSKLTDITMAFVQDSVFQIHAGEEIVEDRKFINDFIENCDSSVFTMIKNRVDELITIRGLPSVKIAASEEMLAAGSEEEINIDVVKIVARFFSGEEN